MFCDIQKSFMEQHNINSSHVHALLQIVIGLIISVFPKCPLSLIIVLAGKMDTFIKMKDNFPQFLSSRTVIKNAAIQSSQNKLRERW